MKRTLINSVSFLAVAVMLTGCDPKNSEKSVKELKDDITQQSQELSAIARDVLQKVRLDGVLLSSGLEKALQGEHFPEKMSADLFAAFGDLDVLELSSTDSPAQGSKPATVIGAKLSAAAKAKREELRLKAQLYGKEVQDQNRLVAEARKKLQDERKKLELALEAEKAKAVLGNDEARERADLYSQLLNYFAHAQKTNEYNKVLIELSDAFNEFSDNLPVNKEVVLGALRTLAKQDVQNTTISTPISTAVAQAILAGGESSSNTSRGEFTLPIANSNGDAAGNLAFRTSLMPFAQWTTTVGDAWLGLLVTNKGGVVAVPGQAPSSARITTDEAVRLIIAVGLNSSTLFGASSETNADPELVASLTNISTIGMIQRSEAFKALSDAQQQLALRAAFAIAHSARASDPLRLEDRMNAMLIAISKLPESGDNASKIAAVRAELRASGVTNPALLTDTLRALTVIAATSGLSSQEQARIMGTVLMIANNTSGGEVSDADFDALVAAVRSNPTLLLGNGPTVPMPARFTIDPAVLKIWRASMQSMDKMLWSAASTATAFIQAANAGARQLIAQGGQAQNPSSVALVTGLREARVVKRSSEGNNSLDIFAGAQGTSDGVSLLNVVELLPTKTALAVLGAAQDRAMHIASNVRSNVLEILAITDSNAASAASADPKVELESFVRIYKQEVGSPRAGLLLSQLRANIESIKGTGHFQQFADVPAEKAKKGFERITPGLMELCDLGEHLKLLYSANENDEMIMPRLVDYILNSKNGLASKLSYRTNGAPGTKRPFGSMKDGTNAEVYNKYLIELGKQLDTYLTNMRDFVMGLVRPQASRVQELDDEGNGLMAKALSNTNLASMSDSVSMRQARMGKSGLDARNLSLGGVSGDRIDLEMPLFVQVNGNITSAKTTDALTGSVAYHLGNTVIGAIQAYANSGVGFGIEGHQLETSMLVSHNVGAFFIECQLGTVSADQVHISDWSGMRAQVTVGVDTQFASPFLQVTHRQLDRNEMISLNETTAYVGLDMDIGAFKTEAYTLNSRLLSKVGYGALNWNEGSKFLGATTGFSGSVEWSGALCLNSGISFSTHLNLDTTSKVSIGLQVSVEH